MPILFKKIADEKDLRGKRVLLRLDLNAPIVNDEVRDDFRIQRSLPTLRMLCDKGARVVIASHIENELTDSLAAVAKKLSESIELKAFVPSLDAAPAVISSMEDGEVVMLENLRRDPGEKENDPAFAARLAALADIYVNDAFAVSHREHASIVSVPKLLPSFAGPLLAEEVDQLSRAFNPPHPFLFILGGAKFDTKLPLVDKFLGIADRVFIGGALANDIFKARGLEIGLSTVSKSSVNLKRIVSDPKLLYPSDIVAASPVAREVQLPTEVGPEERIMDAGPRTLDELEALASKARFILWNGPLGLYEKGFGEGTERLARIIAESKATSVIGGGDTVAVVSNMGILDKFSFASTGGGAMLDFLARGTLPGIEALKTS